MKNLLNKSIIISLFSLFFFSVGTNNIFAADSDFKIDANGVLTKYTGLDTHIVIPNSVTTIGDSVFYDTNIVSVRIPSSVTSIEDSAFAYCRQLTTVNIPDSVTNIGQEAFIFCEKLTSINIPDSITNLKTHVFAGCHSLTSINIPDSVTTIGKEALAFNRFTSINIPASVTSIDRSAFNMCINLESINVSGSNPNYKDIDGVLFNKSVSELIRYPEGKSNTEYTIPNSIISINERAFIDCKNLISISIPDSITSINDFVFDDCENLININIPNSVISIGRYAFAGCYKLKNIDIPISTTNIGDGAFSACNKLESVFIYNKNIEFGSTVFGQSNSLITLYGYKDSTTETYASQNKYKFQDLENQDKPLISISLAKTNINLAVGKSTLNHVIYNPDDTTDDKTVKWSSSDTSIAKVLTNGKIQAISKGNAVITAKVGDLTATCNVTVNWLI